MLRGKCALMARGRKYAEFTEHSISPRIYAELSFLSAYIRSLHSSPYINAPKGTKRLLFNIINFNFLSLTGA
jgi:hypothetical protein